MRRGNIIWLLLWCLGSTLLVSHVCGQDAPAPEVAPGSEARDEVIAQIDELVLQLGADTIGERDLAESNLIKLAELEAIPLDEFLSLLPKDDAGLPPAVRERIVAIRGTLENRRAREATAGKVVTVTAAGWKLSELLDELGKQTGNKVVDARDEFGQQKSDPVVTLIADKLPFWSALDQVLDQAKLDTYGYGGAQGMIQLMQREPGVSSRFGRAAYVGPFRIEPTEVQATRGLRNPSSEMLGIEVELAWEPRVSPIALSLPIDSVVVTTDDGKTLETTQPGRSFDVEVQPGTLVTQMSLPFKLPPRAVSEIAAVSGSLLALLPGKQEEFTFADLRGDKSQVQTSGGVEVTFEMLAKNGEVWELHMRMKIADASDALASHRNWVLSNTTYLVDDKGNTIEHVGFETTMQSENAVGIAYLFELPEAHDATKGLKWIYKTPAAIVKQQFDFKLEKIKLP